MPLSDVAYSAKIMPYFLGDDVSSDWNWGSCIALFEKRLITMTEICNAYHRTVDPVIMLYLEALF